MDAVIKPSHSSCKLHSSSTSDGFSRTSTASTEHLHLSVAQFKAAYLFSFMSSVVTFKCHLAFIKSTTITSRETGMGRSLKPVKHNHTRIKEDSEGLDLTLAAESTFVFHLQIYVK